MIKRSKIKSYLTTSLLVIIAIVMGFSGANQIFSNNSSNYVAQVGKSKISPQEYKKAYDIEKSYLESTIGKYLNEEHLKLLGFKRLVLDKLVQSKLLENLAQSMDLKIGEQDIKTAIKQMKEFQDENGNFVKDKFLLLLEENSIDKSEYIQHIKSVIMKTLLLDTFRYLPGSYLELAGKIYKYRFEEREVEIKTFRPNMIKDISKVATEELEKFYQEHQRKFWSLEQRKAKYIVIRQAAVDNNVIVDEEEVSNILKEYYREKLDISFISFSSEAEAKKTRDELVQANKRISDLSQHETERGTDRALLDHKLQFFFSPEVDENEITQPIPMLRAFYLFQLDKRYKMTEEEEEEIKPYITKSIITDKINERLEGFINSLEDKLSSELSLEEFAEKNHFEIREIGPIDKNHHDQRLVQLIFVEGQGDNFFTSFVNEEGIDEYYITRVVEIIPTKLQEFSQCREQVEEEWKSEFRRKKLSEMAKLNQGGSINQEKIFRTKVAYIESPTQDYPANFVDQIFRIKVGEQTPPIQYKKDDLIIGKLVKINQPKPSKTITKEIEEEIKMNILEGTYTEFKHHLQNKFSVSVNQNYISD